MQVLVTKLILPSLHYLHDLLLTIAGSRKGSAILALGGSTMACNCLMKPIILGSRVRSTFCYDLYAIPYKLCVRILFFARCGPSLFGTFRVIIVI